MINSLIDHTLLVPTATNAQIETLCREAIEHSFFSVCVNPSYVSTCAAILTNSEVKVCTVVGFPLGATTTEVKVFEVKNAIQNGADEIDMVVNIGHVLDNKWLDVEQEISQIKMACNGKLLKVIFETSLLTDEQISKLCDISSKTGADFVKTSTGFSNGGATVEHVRLMRDNVKPDMGVKASGGVRTKEIAQAMINAGASRIGTSAGVSITNGTKAQSNY